MADRLHLFVSGRVQGVFFRAHTQAEAKAQDLRGWVRNLPDGRVEAVAEGNKKELEHFLAWTRQGPPSAHVTSVEFRWQEATGEFEDFRIVH